MKTENHEPNKESKITELTELVKSLEGIDVYKHSKLEETKKISKLVRDLAIDYDYRFERTESNDYHFYGRRIGDECDILVDYCGKVAYSHLDLKRPFKHHYYGNILKILPRKKEIKRFSKAFWAVEEECFLGSAGQRLLAYLAIVMNGGMIGTAFSFYNAGWFLTSKMLSFGALGTLLAIGGIRIDHSFHKKKIEKDFKEYAPSITYNKDALEKAFNYKPSKHMIKED